MGILDLAVSPVAMEMIQDVVSLQNTSGQLPLCAGRGRYGDGVSVVAQSPLFGDVSAREFQLEGRQFLLGGISQSDIDRRLAFAIHGQRELRSPFVLQFVRPVSHFRTLKNKEKNTVFLHI